MSSSPNSDRSPKISGEIYLVSPPTFIHSHRHQLLPDWSTCPQTLILLCFQAKYNLELEGKAIADEKERLFQAFQLIAAEIENLGKSREIFLESICPKSGFPRHSGAGEWIFDLVNIYHECLGFTFKRTEKGCKVLVHPQWQQAIYPGLLIGAEPRDRVAPLVYNALSSPRIEQWSKLTIITSN